MHVVIIDNADSFTWNLWQQVRGLGAACTVVSATDATPSHVRGLKPNRIIISPGPHRPEDAAEALSIIRSFGSTVPLLGVCLGHQCLGVAFGKPGSVRRAPEPVHGKTSLVRHAGGSIFTGVPNPLRVGRYHSLLLAEPPSEFEVIAWIADGSRTMKNLREATGLVGPVAGAHHGGKNGSRKETDKTSFRPEIMAIRHVRLPVFGVQFHPESFLTQSGDRLMKNFLSGIW